MTGVISTSPDPHVRVRRNYLVGLFTSSFGGGMTNLTSSFLIYQQTGRVSFVALIVVMTNLPQLLLPTVATRLAQRLGGPRLYVIVWGISYTMLVVPFVLALTGHLTTITLLGWYLLQGVVQGFGSPAAGLVRTIIAPPGGAGDFNGRAVRAISSATVIGILAGGALLALIGPGWIYLIACLTGYPLVFSVVPLIRAVRIDGAATPSRFSQVFEVQRSNPEIRAAFRFLLIIFLLSGYYVTLPDIANRIGQQAMILSSLQAAAVFGGLFVVIGVRFIHRRATWLAVQRVCIGVVGIAIMYLGWVAFRDHQPTWYLVAAVVAIVPLGFALNLDSAILNAAVQVAAPPEARTPVLTAFALIPLIALPASEIVVGAVADLVSVSFALLMLGGLTLVLVLLPRHASMRAAMTSLDDEHVFPESELGGTTTIGEIEDSGQQIADQVIGPEIPFIEDRER
jgi:MFS family permease